MYNFNELIILNRPQSQGGWVPLKEMKGQEAIAQLEAECLGGICVCGHHIDVHMCTPKRERERKREKERERERKREREREGGRGRWYIQRICPIFRDLYLALSI